MATHMSSQTVRLQSLTSTSRLSRLSRHSRSAFSTAIRPWDRSSRQPTHPAPPSRPTQTLLAHPPTTVPLKSRRHASTAPATPQPIPDDILTWDRFFNLRRRRRYLNLGSSVVTASTAIGIFGPVIAAQDIDGWAANVMGLDPFMVLGATMFAAATMGWLCGPSFGTAMFRLWAGRRGWNGAIAQKEKSFYARIKRYRADPSSSSLSNPIPDYYGEKIASVRDYRRWLKDQRAFNLKKNKNMI